MTYEVVIFGIKLTINPVAFTLPIGENGWSVYWYGILIALGFMSALLYAFKNADRFELSTDKMLDVALVTTPVAVLGARIYYVLFDGVKLNGIKDFFGFGTSNGFSGIAIYGAVIAAFACGGLMCYIRKVNVFDMFDIAAIGFLIGQGIGRWGNFVNQEAYGDFTGSSWWGMESTRTIREMGEGLVHPCFLYESIWCIAGVFVLHAISKKRHFKGEIVLSYGVWYGFGRAIIETMRTDSLMLGNFRVSVLVSALLACTCLAAIVLIRKRVAPIHEEAEYVSILADTDEPITEVTETETDDKNFEEIENVSDN